MRFIRCFRGPGHMPKKSATLMGQDFWPYGVEANRKTLETFLRYSSEQGLIARKLEVEELFLKETAETFKV